MNQEQLQAARAEKWRQKANPLLTLEDAAEWIESTGVSLFLPRKAQLHAPAPSFVEATLGEASPTPAPAAIQNAFELATRLLAEEKTTPLNLFGSVSEQPDFLVSPEALPYIFSLRGDRDWKRGPRERSSPLLVECWKLLKREGALTAPELRELLGREVTEAAVLRALSELWSAMRVLPVYSAGEATAWELFESRHQKAMQVGSGMAQATALSALISLYLDTVIAAATDEIETFLSPLAPRSRIGEVVRGLAATRQLLTIPLGAQSLLYIAGGLPEFPAIEAPAEDVPQTAEEHPRPVQRDRGERAKPQPDRGRKPFAPRERKERSAFGDRPAAREARGRQPGSEGPRKEWKPRREQDREQAGTQGRSGYEKPSRRRERTDERSPRREWKPRREGGQPERGEFRPRRAEGGGFSKPFRSQRTEQRSDDQRPYKKSPPREGEQARPPRREWKPRREGGQPERGEFRPRRAEGRGGVGKPFRSRSAEQGAREQRPYKKFPPREGEQSRPPRRDEGERSEFRPRRSEEPSERREFKPRPSESRGFKPRREGASFGGREKSSDRERFGGKRSSENREGFDRKKSPPRERRAEGGKRSFSSSGSKGRGGFGARKSSFGGKRPGGKPSFGKRPNTGKGKKSSE